MPDPGFVLYQELPRRPLTARNLDDFAVCPQKYLLSFFQPPGETERTLGGSAALHQAVRAALVELYREGGSEAVPPERLAEWFEERWDGAACADSREEEALHREGLELLRKYHEAHSAEPPRVLDSDLRMEAELGGHQFVAIADRVDEGPDGALTLVRYKTTRRPPGPGELAADLSAGLLALVGARHFARPVRVAIEALRPGTVVLAEFPAGAQAELERSLARQAEQIRRATDYPTRQSAKTCRHCRARSRCPAWEKTI